MTEENKLFNYKFEDGKFSFSVDTDKDGEPSVEGFIILDEAIQEAMKKGVPIEGQKSVTFSTSLGGLKMVVDTDKDGQPSGEMNVSFGEVISEVL